MDTNTPFIVTLLEEAVRIATRNPDAKPRTGQQQLTIDIWHTIQNKQRHAGIAPTGTGKSLAHMTCAALAARDNNERTIISTNSLALQTQFIDKDLPVVAEAIKNLTGYPLKYAVLKGVGNYADPIAVTELAQTLTNSKTTDFEKLHKELQNTNHPNPPTGTHPGTSNPKTLKKLALWALETYLEDNSGDRDHCPIEHSNEDWQLISAGADEKASEKDTGWTPHADTAKAEAGEADIVVTNHTLLAMQAAQNIPIVLGSKTLGKFHNIIVDEAHTLPDEVRSRGALEISHRTLKQAARNIGQVLDLDAANEDAEHVAQKLSKTLKNEIRGLKPWEDAHRIPSDQEGPIAQHYDDIQYFVDTYIERIKNVQRISDQAHFQQKCRRAIAALGRLKSAAETATEPGEHVARWISKGTDGHPPRFESSPINVSYLIHDNLWHTPIDEETDEPELYENLPGIPLAVTCVSATLTNNFHYQAALTNPPQTYESPFGYAYANSALYVPRCIDPVDVHALTRDNSNGSRPQFDTFKHEAWAINHIVSLVEANGGSAMILAAKTSSGKKYAEALRQQLPNITTYTQWDGGQTSRIVARWKEDTTSVIVGTKSLMTGVDAPGDTNTLIIVDRPARAAKNVIDEARAEEVTSRTGDKWFADREVYVSDAALLLEQSVGRLIRSLDCKGMVAVLDPRILTSQWSVFTYNQQVRHLYTKPLLEFGSKLNSLADATEWLKARQPATVA